MPKVSVIIPVFNVEKFLRECLDSVINQTLKDIEIICVNDGSTDSSRQIIEEYALHDHRIKLINQSNHGLPYARNRGLENALGEYIYFLDSDDKVALYAMEELYQIAHKNSLDIIYFDSYPIFETKELEIKYHNLKVMSKRKREYKGIRTGLDMFMDMVENHDYSVSSCRQFLSHTYLQINKLSFYEGIIHEDNLFTFLSILQASRVIHIWKEYFYRRVRTESIMTKKETFHNFEGYFVSYVNMLAFAITNKFEDRANKLILQQIKTVYGSAKRIYSKLTPAEKKQKLSPKHGLLTDYLHKEFIASMQYSSIPASVPRIAAKSTERISPDAIRARHFEKELENIRHSFSFRLGRVITFIPRKIRGGVNCCKEHGLLYTVFHAFNKFACLMKNMAIYAKHIGANKNIIKLGDNPPVKAVDNIIIQDQNKKPKPVIKDYTYYKNLNPAHYPDELKIWYYSHLGYELNLDFPQTYNEKIQWMKLYDNSPQKTKLADKYLVREWVASKVGDQYLVPLLGVWDNFDEINFDVLPEQFVLKANHGCGWNIIVKNKKEFNKKEARQKFDHWLNINFSYQNGLELHYKDIPPKIIAEQFMQNGEGDLYDYKVWCFNGVAKFIMFLAERNTEDGHGLKMAFFNRDWELLPFVYSYPQYTKPVPKPANLDELIFVAEKLSKGFNHVRVDFYRLDDGTIIFGEMTFTSAGGRCLWNPSSQDLLLGEMIDLKMCDSTMDIDDRPLVSVIIPVYNAEKYLEECVSSIREQTLKNIEIIVVDDGSTDKSLNILYEHAKLDSRMQVLRQEQQYAGVARNNGLRQACGDYVIFLDSDDYFDVTLLENAYYAAHTANADIVLFGAKRYDQKTNKVSDAPWLLKRGRLPVKQPFSSDDIPEHIFDIVTPCPWTKMFKRTFVLNNNLEFQATQNSNDVLFVLTALAIAKKIVTIDKDLVYYRVGHNNNLQATKYKKPLDFYEAYAALKRSLEERNIFNKIEQSYVNITLSGCLYNLQTNLNGNTRKMIYNALKNHIFYDLGITHYPQDYYFSTANYKEMRLILTASHEEYVKLN